MNRAVALRGRSGAACSLFLFASLVTSLAVAPRTAEARPRPGGGTPFTANKSFGFGLILGEPIGLSAKYYLSASTALDFALGEYDRFREDDDIGVHVDFLWHPVVIATTDPFLLPLYIGLGGRLVGDDDGPDDDDIDFGVRAPVGIALDFNRVPLDVFLELAIVIDLVDDDDDDDDVDLDAAVGIRYYL
jgi:hypothetical protein